MWIQWSRNKCDKSVSNLVAAKCIWRKVIIVCIQTEAAAVFIIGGKSKRPWVCWITWKFAVAIYRHRQLAYIGWIYLHGCCWYEYYFTSFFLLLLSINKFVFFYSHVKQNCLKVETWLGRLGLFVLGRKWVYR